MFQVRIHGRGGQGVVTAAEILSIAAFLQGKHALAFPTFGSERMGAPVTSFCRINETPIRSREPIVNPDALIIQDATLLGHVPLFDGLESSGYVLINSTKSFEDLALGTLIRELSPEHYCTVPATALALEQLGRPVPNAPLLGAFLALTGLLTIESLEGAIRSKFHGRLGEKNVAAARRAYELVAQREVAHAEAG